MKTICKNVLMLCLILSAAFLLVLLASQQDLHAQSTVGMDFWLTFHPLRWEPIKNTDTLKEIRIIVTGERDCVGAVSNPSTGWDTAFTVSAADRTVLKIPREQGFGNGSNQTLGKGLHVITSDSVSVVASENALKNPLPMYVPVFTSFIEATLVLPTSELGDEYILQACRAFHYDNAVLSVIAVEDSTVVDIVATCGTLGGPPANTPLTVTLNAGQSYMLKTATASNIPRDFTGTSVKARGGKRIAVFAGNEETYNFVPSTANNPGWWSWKPDNTMLEQMTPVSRWGKKFVLAGTPLPETDSVRVTSSRDKCLVWRNGELVANLNKNQTFCFCLNKETPAEILETSKPVAVFQYPLYEPYPRDEPGFWCQNCMTSIAPMEQHIKKVAFSTPYYPEGDPNNHDYSNVSTHYVNIVTETVNVATMMMDGKSIASNFRHVPYDHGYSYAKIQIQPGRHILSNTRGGFIAQAYGKLRAPFEAPERTACCYAFSVGSMTHNLNEQIVVDGGFSADYPGGMFFCEGDSPVFSLRTDYSVSRAEWDFGDGTTATGDTVTHLFPTPGTFHITCQAYTLVNGADSLAGTLKTTVHIQQPVENQVWWTICDEAYWNGMHLTQPGDYTAALHTVGGCDSIVNLHLTIKHSDTVFYTIDTCNQYRWRDSLYTESGRYLFIEGVNSSGCDSVASLYLTIRRDPPFGVVGHSQVAYASDIWPGVYRYHVVDSTLLEGGAVQWSCSNPDWVVTPVSDFSCMVFVRTSGQATLTATSAGCQSTASIPLNATPFGVGEDTDKGVLIHPNPAKDDVVVTGEGIRKVEIRNLLGQLVRGVENHDTESLTVSLEGLPQGVYLVSVHLADGKRCEKKLVVH